MSYRVVTNVVGLHTVVDSRTGDALAAFVRREDAERIAMDMARDDEAEAGVGLSA